MQDWQLDRQLDRQAANLGLEWISQNETPPARTSKALVVSQAADMINLVT